MATKRGCGGGTGTYGSTALARRPLRSDAASGTVGDAHEVVTVN